MRPPSPPPPPASKSPNIPCLSSDSYLDAGWHVHTLSRGRGTTAHTLILHVHSIQDFRTQGCIVLNEEDPGGYAPAVLLEPREASLQEPEDTSPDYNPDHYGTLPPLPIFLWPTHARLHPAPKADVPAGTLLTSILLQHDPSYPPHLLRADELSERTPRSQTVKNPRVSLLSLGPRTDASHAQANLARADAPTVAHRAGIRIMNCLTTRRHSGSSPAVLASPLRLRVRHGFRRRLAGRWDPSAPPRLQGAKVLRPLLFAAAAAMAGA
ncbi:hypothetical protein ONZ51_g620 [Trametes cubensis]|uniref:Uncharacterized protein n=1 Tax=Trametes cubensis TaxID=1111947 RepID=A0AAD7U349_9APHY|nr:hypothetical protein ONZ51_g620 [Trametes cubensis]